VYNEARALLAGEMAAILRFHDDRTATVMAAPAEGPGHRVGTRVGFDPGFVIDWVYETHRAARFDTDDPSAADQPEIVRRIGVRSAVGSPIVVDGELWGVIVVASLDRSLPLGMERRLADFTDLVATAIANAESKAELAASRKRIVAASDDARRRIERDLHDGVQQQLVSLGLEVGKLEAGLRSGDKLKQPLASVSDSVGSVLDSLVEVARGIHPAILSQGGLEAALHGLARRAAVPVELDARIDDPLPDEIQVAAHYVASEALTNVAKHARASVVHMGVTTAGEALTLVIRDDGVGGADLGRGSGLVGLRDRVEALGGTITIDSSAGKGTCIAVTLPIATDQDQEIEHLLGPPQERRSPRPAGQPRS
jgi:signal transduction histidine kinase